MVFLRRPISASISAFVTGWLFAILPFSHEIDNWCVAISPGTRLAHAFSNKLLLCEIKQFSLFSFASRLWSKSTKYTFDNNIWIRFRIGYAIAWVSRFQHIPHVVAYVSLLRQRTRFNSRPDIGSLYICEGIGALRLSRLFSRRLSVCNDCKDFRTYINAITLIACYLSAGRCLTYAESPCDRLRLSDYAYLRLGRLLYWVPVDERGFSFCFLPWASSSVLIDPYLQAVAAIIAPAGSWVSYVDPTATTKLLDWYFTARFGNSQGTSGVNE